ncbi:hypothetical protein BS78_05G049700 [Paspalum vaginatum]|nr:hypothetical protein BS78_05G049700 [Paspalum vaginatum]
MARTTTGLLLLLLVAVVAEAAPFQLEWSDDAKKSIGTLYPKLAKAFEGVRAAAPPGKEAEFANATATQMMIVTKAIAQAGAKRDNNKAIELATSYVIAADLVIQAAPAEKLEVMEESFNAVSAPNPLACPGVDKAYCEAYAKVQKALDAVAAVAPAREKMDTKEGILKKGFSKAVKAINIAYARGDEKEIAAVLAAYTKAADAVIAAPPAEKFKVMEATFAEAATAATGASSKKA